MKVYIDIATQKIIQTPAFALEILIMNFKRGATSGLDIQFVDNGSVVALPLDATGSFEVKETDKYDEDPLTGSAAWTVTGTGTNTLYSFSFSFVNTDIDTLFSVDGDPENDVAVLSCMAEIQWITGGVTYKTSTFTVNIANDVIRDGDVLPNLPPIAYGVFLPNITGLSGGGDTNLDGVATVGLRSGMIIEVLVEISSVREWLTYVLTEGASAGATPGIVTPLDYNALTNDRRWVGAVGPSGPTGESGYSGYSGSGISGYSGYSGLGLSGYSGYSSRSGYSGFCGLSGYSGFSGESGYSGYSGYSGSGLSGYSGYSGPSGYSGYSGFCGLSGYSGYSGKSGYSGYSGSGLSGYSGFSGFGLSGFSGYSSTSGYSGYSGISGYSGFSGSGVSGYSGYSGSGTSGYSGFSGSGLSGYSGFSGRSGFSGYSGFSSKSGYSGFSGANPGASGYSGFSSKSGYSGYSGKSGYSGANVSVLQSLPTGSSATSPLYVQFQVAFHSAEISNNADPVIMLGDAEWGLFNGIFVQYTSAVSGWLVSVFGSSTTYTMSRSVDTFYTIDLKIEWDNTSVTVTPRFDGTAATPATATSVTSGPSKIQLGSTSFNSFPVGVQINRSFKNVTIGTSTWGSNEIFDAPLSSTIVPPFDSEVDGSDISIASSAMLVTNNGTSNPFAYAIKTFASPGSNAYLEKSFTPVSDVWLTFDLYFSSAALAFWSSGDNWSGLFGTLGDAFFNRYADVYIQTSAAITNWFVNSVVGSVSPTAGVWHTCEIHYNAGTVDLYVNAQLLATATTSSTNLEKVRIGQDDGPPVSSDSKALFKHVTVGTTRHGIDLFAPSEGTLVGWDTVVGNMSVVLDPTGGAYSGYSGFSGYSGYSGANPGASGYSGFCGKSGYSGYSGSGISGYSGYSGTGLSGFSGYSGDPAQQSGYSGYSGISGYSGYSGFSGANPGASGYSGYSGANPGASGYSGYSGPAGAGSLLVDGAVRADIAYGNDGTGTVGDLGKPFLTVAAAISALEGAGPPSNATIYLGTDAFIEDITTSLTNLTVIGEGASNPAYINSITFSETTTGVVFAISEATIVNITASTTGGIFINGNSVSITGTILNSTGQVVVSGPVTGVCAGQVSNVTASTNITISDTNVYGTISSTGAGDLQLANLRNGGFGGSTGYDFSYANVPTIDSAGSIAYIFNSVIGTVTAADQCYLIDSVIQGSDSSTFATIVDKVMHAGLIIRLRPSTTPSFAREGMVYANASDHHLYFYDGTTWKQLDN